MTDHGAGPDAGGMPPLALEVLAADRLSGLHYEPPIVALRASESASAGRFEGVYGGIYNRVIQTRLLRRAAFSIWGSADPLYDLDTFVEDAVAAAQPAPRASSVPLLVDVPSGGGTLLPFLARNDFAGDVIEVDLAEIMLRRAVGLHRSSTPHLPTVFLQSDALDLPLEDAVADVVVSINGLHVVPDPARFLSELARITKPGGTCWLITPVDGPSARSRLILAAARRLGITPGRPPTLPRLRQLLEAAGYQPFRDYGGSSITGIASRKS